MNDTQLQQLLLARSGGGSRYGLERMQALVQALGRPQRGYEIWHVAGTNGKGSVAAMLESIARCAGHRTGLNTSPHLCRLTERIRVDGIELAPEQMIAAFEQVEQRRQEARIEATFFETLTAMALVAFARAEVDVAVLEVGLGGRLDATNSVDSQVAAVVSIDLDHTRILGDTRAKIAREKAAIARRDRPLVVGALDAESLVAVLDVARTIGARPVLLRDHLHSSGQAREVRHPQGTVTLKPSLDGPHQVHNAGVAALMALEAGVDPAAIEKGIGDTRWRGRLQRVERHGQRYLLDCAHNLAGARALGLALSASREDDYALLLATSGGRDTGAFVEALARHAGWPRSVCVTQPPGHRLNDCHEVARRVRPVLPDGVSLSVEPDSRQALLSQAPAGLWVVSGSMYLVGHSLGILGVEPTDEARIGR